MTPADIAALRHRRLLTQAQLGQLLGVTTQCVSNWECGRTTPWPRYRAKLHELDAVVQRPGKTCGGIAHRILSGLDGA